MSNPGNSVNDEKQEAVESFVDVEFDMPKAMHDRLQKIATAEGKTFNDLLVEILSDTIFGYKKED